MGSIESRGDRRRESEPRESEPVGSITRGEVIAFVLMLVITSTLILGVFLLPY